MSSYPVDDPQVGVRMVPVISKVSGRRASTAAPESADTVTTAATQVVWRELRSCFISNLLEARCIDAGVRRVTSSPGLRAREQQPVESTAALAPGQDILGVRPATAVPAGHRGFPRRRPFGGGGDGVAGVPAGQLGHSGALRGGARVDLGWGPAGWDGAGRDARNGVERAVRVVAE